MKRLLLIGLICAALCGFSKPLQIVVTSAGVTAQSPGPSAALFASPYYTCSTNRYVATTGSDSNNGTSQATPWLTLAHANSQTPSAGYCINVAAGTYAAGLAVTHGGNLASTTGYVVYRCQTLNGCTITDPGNNGSSYNANAGVFVGANYVWFDGFVFNSSPAQQNQTSGFQSSQACCAYTFSFHHIWLTNSIVTGYGIAGISFDGGEYHYAIHNKVYVNAANTSCNGGFQGSGIAYNTEIPVAGYTPTADDGDNGVTGNTGSLFHNFILWNTVYNNHVAGCGAGGSTDGNGIILDTFNWNCNAGGSGCTASAVPYVNGTLVASNVVYNNGGGGLHIFNSEYATVANNSCYNNYIDTGFPNGGTYACMDSFASYGGNYINNIAVIPCSAAPTAQAAIGVEGQYAAGPFTTTLLSAITSTSATSVSLTSDAKMPGSLAFSSAGWYGSGAYTLPGGNIIQVDSELMLVTAGWGTTTLTVTRGYLGTTAATHLILATVTWGQNYYSNNVTYSLNQTSCPDVVNTGNDAPGIYQSSQNKETTNPLWTNVGNTSKGTDSTQPVGTNFALSAGSPATGYGQTHTWLPTTASDAGACSSSLTTCP